MTEWAAKVLENVPRHYDANCDRVILEADALAAIEAEGQRIRDANAKLAEGDGLVERATAALEGVTAPVWNADGYRVEAFRGKDQDGADYWEAVAECENEQDARFIAWCREGVPALIALATAQAAQIAGMQDPVAVHANMLRGTIAKPTVDQIIHLYGREAFQPMIDAAVAKALGKACLAVSEHANWPEDEHGRTEQVGLFARVINAICAIAPAAPHVNETPKSEHDAGNVLTDAALIARLREIQGQAGLFASAAADLITALLVQNAALRAERDELSSKLEVERALTDAVHRLAKAAEAKVARLVEALTNLPAVYAHQINTGVREVYDPLQRFYTMESVLTAINEAQK